ncbi:hypothetical protein [Paenibacillus andongensis]|uniref:hypothetical protein n=1 Tax=Paenibacillus andongensis TaxID=2975482 RepID=UPI0021BAA7FC|nr:hypothetical protein [Paenibacillus andongensis]
MSSLQFASVTDKGIEEFLKQAQKRIIFVKPAYYKWEIDLVLNIIEKRQVYCELYVEKNDSAIRAGFGDTHALKMINENRNLLHPQLKDCIRMAIIVVDNRTLFYMPKITFLDEDSYQYNFPNGLYGDMDITKLVLDKFPVTEIDIPEMEEYQIPFELERIESSHQEVIEKEIDDTLRKLEGNPPVDPNKLKRIHFYRNNYKLLKIQLRGIKIENRKINIKPFYKLLSESQERLNNSWDVFLQQDVKELEDMSIFQVEIQKINSKYLFDAGRFGYLVRTNNKHEYSSKMQGVKQEFIAFVQGNPGTDNRFVNTVEGQDKDTHENKITFKTGIDSILIKSRSELAKHLKKESANDDGFFQRILNQYRSIKRIYEHKQLDKVQAIEKAIDMYIDDQLKFPQVDEILERIDVILDYYDLSDELIYENEDFKKVLDKHKLHEVRVYMEGLEQMELF